LFNHSFTLDMSKALAARIEKGDAINDVIIDAYSFAFQRPPSETELKAAEQLIAKFGREAFCRALLNANELLYLE
jgi:hypothetical protein